MEKKCPICEAEGTITKIKMEEDIDVRGEKIHVEYDSYRCNSCEEILMESTPENDPLNIAYRRYRENHNMLQPEEIRDIRKKYGITQSELARVMGLGDTTLSRYENGGLQDKAYDSQLKLISDPRNMLRIVRDNSELFGEKRASSLISQLEKVAKDEYPLERCMEELFGSDERSIYTGYQALNIDKILNSILYFCKDGLLKTKINKYLFYADFKHFKEYKIGITGSNYVHLPHGPVPNNYDIYLSTFLRNGYLEIEEVFYPDPNIVGEKYISIEKGLLSDFSDSEILILSTVKQYFKDFTAKSISDYSHKEKAYQETADKEFISYEYAEYLAI
jgi:putative zinc finger/helix-turn-helix YgiT family protein